MFSCQFALKIYVVCRMHWGNKQSSGTCLITTFCFVPTCDSGTSPYFWQPSGIFWEPSRIFETFRYFGNLPVFLQFENPSAFCMKYDLVKNSCIFWGCHVVLWNLPVFLKPSGIFETFRYVGTFRYFEIPQGSPFAHLELFVGRKYAKLSASTSPKANLLHASLFRISGTLPYFWDPSGIFGNLAEFLKPSGILETFRYFCHLRTFQHFHEEWI